MTTTQDWMAQRKRIHDRAYALITRMLETPDLAGLSKLGQDSLSVTLWMAIDAAHGNDDKASKAWREEDFP